jgi:lipopolysaccharide exporter
MTLRRLNSSVLSPLLAFPIAWVFGALLSQVHLLDAQGAWPNEMIAVVAFVPFAFIAGGLIGEGIATAATALSRKRIETRISERTFRRMLKVIVAIGLLEVAHQFARAGTIPLLSGSIDAARFSEGGPTVVLTDLLTVAAILALTKPPDLFSRNARFELGIAAVSIGAFALQGGRGSVVLPIVVAILARWLYWGRPNAYVLTTGLVLAVLAISIGFYLRVYQHPTTPFESELFGEILPPLPFFVKPLIPVYLAITTNFLALQGIIGHFPTVAPYGHGAYDAVAFDNFISGTKHVGDVSAITTPPWVTSTVAGSFWADGAFGWIVPGMAAAGAVAGGAYAAAIRTQSFRWATAAAYLFFVALFGLYTNLWTQQIDWLIVVPLLIVFGAFAENPEAPPGIVGRAWFKISPMHADQSSPTTAPEAAPSDSDERSPKAPRSYRNAAIAGLGAISILLIAGLAIQATLPEPYPLVATKKLPASVASAQQVMTDGDHPGDNTALWWINRKGDQVTLRSIDPSRLNEGISTSDTFHLADAAEAKFDVGQWPPLRNTALFIFRYRGNNLETLVWDTEKNRAYRRFISTVSPPLPGATRDLAIASWAGKNHPDLLIVDRNERNARVRVRVLDGNSGFRHQDLATTLPFRGLNPREWSVDAGSIVAAESEEKRKRPIYRADLALIQKDPDRAHANLKVMLGEDGYNGFSSQRDLDISGRVPPESSFLIGTLAGATSIYQVLPHTAQFEAAQTPDPGTLGITAARGVGVLVGRTLGLQLLTAGVTIILARILTPADYGLFAIALAVQMVGQRAAELGLPAALVRMEEEPTARLQSSIWGILLLTSTILAGALLVATFVLLPALGADNQVLEAIAVAGCAIPFYAARATPMALMEREMSFGRVAAVETVETLVFNGFALTAALAGLGAFSLSGAVTVGAVAGMAIAWALQPFARRPHLDLEPIRPLFGFGLQVSVLQGIYLVRELGFVSLIAAVGGTSSTGFYAMAKRLFSFPIALTSAVARVSFPALSKEPDLRPSRAAKAATYTAIAAGLPLAVVAGAIHPLIEVVLGSQWQPTADVVLLGSLGMMLNASAEATLISLALAEGKPRYPLIASIVEITVAFVVVIALVGPLKEAGIGIALSASILAATVVLVQNAHPQVSRAMLAVGKATLIAAGAAATGHLVGGGESVIDLMVSLTVVSVVWIALELVFSRSDVARIASIARPLFRRATPV